MPRAGRKENRTEKVLLLLLLLIPRLFLAVVAASPGGHRREGGGGDNIRRVSPYSSSTNVRYNSDILRRERVVAVA